MQSISIGGGGGVTPLAVADLTDPSVELNAIAGTQSGDMRLCYKADSWTDSGTLYAWDSAASGTERVPHAVDGLTGRWYAIAGNYVYNDLDMYSDLIIRGETPATDKASGSLILTGAGGIGCGGKVWAQNLEAVTTTTSANLTITNLTTLQGSVDMSVGTASTSTTTGTLKVVGGVGVTGNVSLDGGAGASLRVANVTVNSGVATTLGSTGPTGATAGAPQGWLRVSHAGTDRYIPFW